MLSSEGQENTGPIMLYSDTVHRCQCTETFTNVMPNFECWTHTIHRSQCTETFTNVMLSPEDQENPSPIMKLYRPDTVHPGQCMKLSPTLCRILSVGRTRCNSQCTETSINVMPSSECRAKAQSRNVIPRHGAPRPVH